jgi:hypothetical protein
LQDWAGAKHSVTIIICSSFAAVLHGISYFPHLYVFVDAEVTQDQYEAQWPQVFELLFRELTDHKVDTIAKCALGPEH